MKWAKVLAMSNPHDPLTRPTAIRTRLGDTPMKMGGEDLALHLGDKQADGIISEQQLINLLLDAARVEFDVPMKPDESITGAGGGPSVLGKRSAGAGNRPSAVAVASAAKRAALGGPTGSAASKGAPSSSRSAAVRARSSRSAGAASWPSPATALASLSRLQARRLRAPPLARRSPARPRQPSHPPKLTHHCCTRCCKLSSCISDGGDEAAHLHSQHSA